MHTAIRPPRFGITLNVSGGIEAMDTLNHSYVRWCEDLGVVPILLPNKLSDPVNYCRKLNVDGIILTGGNDLSGQEYVEESRSQSLVRDETEYAILAEALNAHMPVIGICRGLQFLNVYFGGHLLTNISTRSVHFGNHAGSRHKVNIVSHPVRSFLGVEMYTVNSFHNHGVALDGLAPSLEPFAISDGDKLVEGVIPREHKIVGIQWHPERPGSDVSCDMRLFSAFLNGNFGGKSVIDPP